MEQEWQGGGHQKHVGEDACRHDWLLDLDADEIVSDELAREVRALFAGGGPDANVYRLSLVTVDPSGRIWRTARAPRRAKLYDRRKVRMPAHGAWDQFRIPPGAPGAPAPGTDTAPCLRRYRSSLPQAGQRDGPARGFPRQRAAAPGCPARLVRPTRLLPPELPSARPVAGRPPIGELIFSQPDFGLRGGVRTRRVGVHAVGAARWGAAGSSGTVRATFLRSPAPCGRTAPSGAVPGPLRCGDRSRRDQPSAHAPGGGIARVIRWRAAIRCAPAPPSTSVTWRP